MSATIDRCLLLLEILAKADNPMSFTAICEEMGSISHATLTRLLHHLVSRSYISKNPVSGHYTTGERLSAICRVKNQNRSSYLINRYSLLMDRIARKFDVTIFILEKVKNTLINIKKCQTEISPHMQEIGTINADWEEPWIQTMASFDDEFNHLFKNHPEYSRLAKVKSCGYYYDNMEKRDKYRRLAFPLFDPITNEFVGLLGLGGSTLYLTDEKVAELIQYIKHNI